MEKRLLLLGSLFALLLSSCQKNPTTVQVINEVKLQKGYSENVLKNNTKAKEFTNAIADFVLQNAMKTSAIAPTEVLMNYATILFASANTQEKITNLGFADYDELATAYKNMQSFLNYNYKDVNFLKTTSFYQLVDIVYDQDALRDIYEKTDISVIKSSLSHATSDAKAWINAKTGVTINPPQVDLPGVYSYNAMNLKDVFSDSVFSSQTMTKISYHESASREYEVDALSRKSTFSYYYDEVKQFQFVRFPVGRTELLLVLPDENVSLSSISFKDIDLAKAVAQDIELTLPLFEVALEQYDITDFMSSKLTGVAPFDLITSGESFISLSTNIFELNRYGVSGQSITMSGAPTSAQPPIDVIELTINRPFYAISAYQNQPLFAIKVININ